MVSQYDKRGYYLGLKQKQNESKRDLALIVIYVIVTVMSFMGV